MKQNEMDKKIGCQKLIEIIGPAFYEQHKESACFAYGETEEDGTFCFLGFDLRTDAQKEKNSLRLSEITPMDPSEEHQFFEQKGWTYYASCYVKNGKVRIYNVKKP